MENPQGPVATIAEPAEIAAPDTATTLSGAPVSPGRWLIVGALVAGTWSMTLPSISFGVMLPAISDSLHLSTLQAGWLGSSLRIGNALVMIPAAVVMSRANPARLYTLAIALAAGFTFLHGLAPVFAVLFLARFGFGLAFAMRTPVGAMLTQQWFPLREVPLVNGLTIGLASVAEAVALAVTPIVLDSTGSWRTTYFVYGGFAVIVTALWLTLGRRISPAAPPAAVTSGARASLRRVLRQRQVWLVGLGTMGATFGWWAFSVFWPTYVLDANGISVTTSGFLLSLISIGTIPSSLLLGFYASRVRHRRWLLIVSAVAMAGASFGMLLTTQTLALAFFALLSGVSWAYLPIALSVPYETPELSQREVAIALSMMTTLFMVAGVLGPIVVGAISEATGSLYTALLVGAAAPLTLAMAAMFMRERRAA